MKRFFALLSVAGLLFSVFSCNEKPADQDSQSKDKIVIDGDFSDWMAMDTAPEVGVAKNDPNSLWEGVREIRCFATKDYIYYYIKYDREILDEQLEAKDPLHIRLCLNTDGEFTSGYNSYFLDSYDFILEGALAEDGAWKSFDATLYQRTFVEAKGKVDWLTLLEPGKGLVVGAGQGAEYEISLKRELFDSSIAESPNPNSPIGDVFHTGIRFYCNGWSELSNMPNASAEVGSGNGWAHLMEITTSE